MHRRVKVRVDILRRPYQERELLGDDAGLYPHQPDLTNTPPLRLGSLKINRGKGKHAPTSKVSVLSGNSFMGKSIF